MPRYALVNLYKFALRDKIIKLLPKKETQKDKFSHKVLYQCIKLKFPCETHKKELQCNTLPKKKAAAKDDLGQAQVGT